MGRTIADICDEVSQGSAYRRKGRLAAWWKRFCEWPPNVFGLTSVLLEESGAYRFVVSPPFDEWKLAADHAGWRKSVEELAGEWAEWLAGALLASIDEEPDKHRPFGDEAAKRAGPLPKGLRQFGDLLDGSSEVPVRELRNISHPGNDADFCVAVLTLHAAADLASAGFGVPPKAPQDNPTEPLVAGWARDFANRRLSGRGTLAYLSVASVRVLPKYRTPQVGLTLRSMSHHLAAIRSEIRVRWRAFPGLCDPRLNLLLVPWPLQLDAESFRESPAWWHHASDGFSAFQFVPRPAESVVDVVARALAAAKKLAPEIHGVVLPESAVLEEEFQQLIELLGREERKPFLLTGVRGERRNCAYLALHGARGGWTTFKQDKHHRWKLDARQIEDYALDLPGDRRRYWEDIAVPGRSLRFTTITDWLTMCHLICEDLARVDPAAEVIRAVGPNLVVALLLDGPQIGTRWPARYASVLADDPGSSVLTLSALGMVRRSVPAGKSPSQVVALWRDARRGTFELNLEPGASALVLRVRAEQEAEWTADGRSEGQRGQLVFREVLQVKLAPRAEDAKVAPRATAARRPPRRKIAPRARRR